MSLKIALLTYSTKPRGGVIHTLELAAALQELGHQVCVYALSKDSAGLGRSLNCGQVLVPALPVSGGIDVVIQQRIREYVDHFRQSTATYDIYHAQDCISANALLVLRSEGRIRHFVRTIHHIEDYSSPYLQDCQDRSIREPDLCLCVSSFWQVELKQQVGIQALRVTNGVDPQRFSPIGDGSETALKAKFGLSGSPIFLTIGGIEPRKNSTLVLQAFLEVLSDLPQAQWVIAGGDTLFDYQDYQRHFWQLVERSGLTLGQELIQTGSVADWELAALYRIADALVFPSLKEGWGLVVLEAIAARLPVITARHPPFTEFLSEDQALLVDPYSPTSVAQAMKKAIDPVIAKMLIENSQSVLEQYTWSRSAQLHLESYQRILSPSPLSVLHSQG